MSLSRRQLLKLGAAAGLCAGVRPAWAIGEASEFKIGLLAMSNLAMDLRPRAFQRLLWEIEKRTSIQTARAPITLSVESDKLFDTPFLYLFGNRDFVQPSTAGIDRLRRHLRFGGLLVIDSSEGALGGGFDRSVRKLCASLFPPSEATLSPISAEHVIYKSFYLIDRPVGRLALSGVMEGISVDKRIMVTYVQNDLAGAWAESNTDENLYPCEPGGERQRQMSIRLGVNLAMYALCLDYKEDQVHLPFIMRRRKWRSEP